MNETGRRLAVVRSVVRRTTVGVGTNATRWMVEKGHISSRTLTVLEFPKSGGTWLARMLSSLLEWPFLDDTAFPPDTNCVLRGHQLPKPTSRDLVYMVRDPRDVYVSLYYHRLHHWDTNRRYRTAWLARHAHPLGTHNISDELAEFLRFEFEFVGRRGSASPKSWGEHYRSWVASTPSTHGRVLVRYEELRAQTAQELQRIYQETFGGEVPVLLAEAVAECHSINLRREMLAHPTVGRSFIRSGTSGGWRSAFTAESAEVLNRECGDVMMELGYVDSPDWWAESPGRAAGHDD